jgi:hypothetical protein
VVRRLGHELLYRRIPPCAALRPFVESFWIQEHLVASLVHERQHDGGADPGARGV